MNFHVVEGKYADLESIHDDFCNDYLWSNKLSNQEIRKKYDLTVGEFDEICKKVKAEHGFTRRPLNGVQGKYYYKHKNKNSSWSIQKCINNKMIHFGVVPTPEIAEIIVKMCIDVNWNIPICKDIVRNWRCYVGS